MAKLIYRGVVNNRSKAPKSLADQMRRPVLVYRGVVHNGEHAVQPKPDRSHEVYRGAHFA